MRFFKKKFSILICLTMLVIFIMEISVFSAHAADKTITSNEIGTDGDYSYELWKDSGNTTMTLGSNGTFNCQWDSINNALFRRGIKLDSTKTYRDLGDITVDYNCDYYPSGNSYLCVYGWSVDPLVEYYIVDSWGTWRPPGSTSKGTITVDGGTYDVYETTRTNQPSIQGTATFKQYWSVRTSKRTSGTISVDEHFKAWEDKGMTLGKLYEVALTVEGYQSSGSANVTKNVLTIGSSSQSNNSNSSNDTNDKQNTNNNENSNNSEQNSSNSSWVNNADISWIDPSKKIVAFTFDDGPVGTQSSNSSQRILDVIEKYNAHCTFFYNGNKINESTKDEIKRAYSLGCEVGNHTYSHVDLTTLSKENMLSEISKTNDLLSQITGESTSLVRAPYGNANTNVLSTINAPFINWSVDSGDWNNASYDSVISTLRNKIKDGSIVLMHETYDFTADAVETIVPELIEKGYQIVSVSELMKIKNVSLNNGELYTNNAENKQNIDSKYDTSNKPSDNNSDNIKPDTGNQNNKDDNKDNDSNSLDDNSSTQANNNNPTTDNKDNNENIPKTGDSTYIVVACIGVITTGLLAIYYKRKQTMYK